MARLLADAREALRLLHLDRAQEMARVAEAACASVPASFAAERETVAREAATLRRECLLRALQNELRVAVAAERCARPPYMAEAADLRWQRVAEAVARAAEAPEDVVRALEPLLFAAEAVCTLRELWQRGQWEEVARLADRLHALRPPLHACAHPDVTMALDAAAFHLLLRARPDIRPEGLRLSVTARGGSAREVADRLAELEAQAERALEALDREAAQRCLEGASALLLPLRQAAQCVELLALPSDAYHRLCLQRGMARGDYSMVATATCALKEGLLSAQAHKYRLSACPLLRTPHEFAGAAAGAAEAGRGMLSHSPVPLRRSLTVLPPTLEATALQLFRCVLGFAGERRYSYPAALAQQLVAACAAGPQAVRDEVYCQLMKQCTDNPDVRSRRRVWLLMALAVAHFPPSDALENFLECFLRAHGERECVRALHLTAVAGPRTQPPAVEEIEALEAEVEPQLPSRAAPPALADGRAATPFRHAASDL